MRHVKKKTKIAAQVEGKSPIHDAINNSHFVTLQSVYRTF